MQKLADGRSPIVPAEQSTCLQLAGFSESPYACIYDDHPPPHFHAYYGDFAAKIDIDTLNISEGQLPRRALALVLEWAVEHRHELRENWHLADQHRPLNAIDPLQ